MTAVVVEDCELLLSSGTAGGLSGGGSCCAVDELVNSTAPEPPTSELPPPLLLLEHAVSMTTSASVDKALIKRFTPNTSKNNFTVLHCNFLSKRGQCFFAQLIKKQEPSVQLLPMEYQTVIKTSLIIGFAEVCKQQVDHLTIAFNSVGLVICLEIAIVDRRGKVSKAGVIFSQVCII